MEKQRRTAGRKNVMNQLTRTYEHTRDEIREKYKVVKVTPGSSVDRAVKDYEEKAEIVHRIGKYRLSKVRKKE